MNWLLREITTVVTAFAATNIDDIVILMLLFAQVNPNFRRRHIVIGQYLGFIGLIVVSLPGFLGGLIVPPPWIGLLGFVPMAIGITNLINKNKDDAEVQMVSGSEGSKNQRFVSCFHPQIYKVAAVTFANGGDNIAIYVPLFARSNWASLGVILAVFLVLVAVWCYVVLLLTRQKAIAYVITRYGHAFAPFILIGLGFWILLESKSYKLLLS